MLGNHATFGWKVFALLCTKLDFILRRSHVVRRSHGGDRTHVDVEQDMGYRRSHVYH